MKDKNLGFRLFVILLVIGLSAWSLKDSIGYHSLEGDAKKKFREDNPKEVANAINFGLDLAGGTHIVLELDGEGLDEKQLLDAQERTLEIIRNRVDKFGVSEPVIATSGKNRIVVDLAGVPAEEARDMVGSTAKLEFRMVSEVQQFSQVFNRIVAFVDSKSQGLKPKVQEDSTQTAADKLLGEDPLAELVTGKVADANQEVAPTEVIKTEVSSLYQPFASRSFKDHFVDYGNANLAVLKEDISVIRKVINEPAIQNLIPPNMILAWGYGYEKLQNNQDSVKLIYPVKSRREMDGKDIVDASSGRSPEGGFETSIVFGGIGPKRFYTVTKNNVGNNMAIILDGQVVSAPSIKQAISGGRAVINGLDDLQEAKQLAVVLKAGALPVKSEIVELREVGASLGVENVNSGLFAGAVGLALVIGFMVLYYLGAGINSVIALVVNIVIIGAIMSMFHATLTLPGIAGIILTIGMAVDANVIIFERIREELRSGRSSRMAIHNGYAKAFTSIIDANVTTFLTAFILYQIGSGPIKGFGLTLMIGIAASLFTALYLTRFVFDAMAKDTDSSKLSIGSGLKFLNNPKFAVLKKAKVFSSISAVLFVVSLGLLATKGLNYSIDFTGGNIITIDVEGETNPQEVEQVLKSANIDVGSVKPISSATGGDDHIMISLSNQEGSGDARSAVAAALSASGIKSKIISEDLVGPSIGKDLKSDALMAVFWALIIILAYIRIRFGRNGFGFGFGSIVALGHDVIITLGIFTFFGIQVDAATIAAFLTIVGYSLNDTIVVFDRIRENTELMGKDSYGDRVNTSVNESFSRTFITSITTLFVVVILAVFGGLAIRDFAIAMTIGVVIGTYSSIFIASPFVVWWASRRPID